MQWLAYIFTAGFFWLLHFLPDRILYFLSDILFLILYYILGYRRKVVRNNLERALPELRPDERRRIEKKFYHHLCDLTLETSASHFWSDRRYLKKISFRNIEVLEDLYSKGKQVIGVTAHYGNWEYTIAVGHHTGYRAMGAYKPLKNPWFDRMIRKSRSRFNTLPMPMEKIARAQIQHAHDGILTVNLMVADQRPTVKNTQYWTRFMGLDTAMYLGSEKLARKVNAAVVFLKIRRPRRGHYEVDCELITEDPQNMEIHEITDRHVGILEDLIREAPQYWLWSHNRWKHSYEHFLEIRERQKRETSTPGDKSA